jgi:hypothetical protein
MVDQKARIVLVIRDGKRDTRDSMKAKLRRPRSQGPVEQGRLHGVVRPMLPSGVELANQNAALLEEKCSKVLVRPMLPSRVKPTDQNVDLPEENHSNLLVRLVDFDCAQPTDQEITIPDEDDIMKEGVITYILRS